MTVFLMNIFVFKFFIPSGMFLTTFIMLSIALLFSKIQKKKDKIARKASKTL